MSEKTHAEIIAEVRRQSKVERKNAAKLQERGDDVNYGIGCSIEEDANYLESLADRLEAAHRRERISPDGEAGAAKRSLEGCDCAKLREALKAAELGLFRWLSGSISRDEHRELVAMIKTALAAPPRNCDRFGGDIDKLREACARERGLNPEEDFPDVFPDWLLALAQEGGAK